MSATTQETSLERARAAAGRGEWPDAYNRLVEADATAPLTGPDLAFLADVAYAAGRLDVTISSWERAHAEGLRAGDRFAAGGAAVRVAMHLLFDTGLMAPVRGWIRRAERLLEANDETPVHAWLAVVRSYERLLSGDFQSAREWAGRAVEVGTKCDPAAAAIGRVAEARSLILGGEVSRGLALLNEAAVATVSGELDPFSTGIVYCEVVCAFQALAQYDLAEEWTAAMEGWRHGQPVGSIHGRCRVHRAEILRLRGFCLEAEQEALVACEELRPYLRRELGWPLTELGDIRLRRGDIRGAEEAFRAAHEVGWDAQPGLALVHLAKGDLALAVQSIRDALEHPLNVPSKELPPHTELRQAPLLEAQVEIEIAAGDLRLARAAADQLSRIAASFESKALAAGAAVASASVTLAEGDAASARRGFEEAVQLWNDIGAPYETALARMGLAHAHRAAGNEQRAILEFQGALSGFERVGAVQHAADAARARAGVRSNNMRARDEQPRSAPLSAVGAVSENVFRLEGDYWSVTFDGRTVRLRDLKGLRYVARLLADPAREVHVLDLVAGERGPSADAGRGAQSGVAYSSTLADVFLDSQAKEAYRRRLAEIAEDIEEAHAMGNSEQAAQAEAEREFLIRELTRAVGLGGRDRPAGSPSERARASVTRAIRQAMARIREHHPGLGEHLDRAIRTGTYCAYLPDPRVPAVWQL
jgi:tetratricopeptide (TPR) repeat protein